MKSVFKNMFACSVLMLASVVANATTGHWALSHEIAFKHNVATYAFALDASTKVSSNSPVDRMAAKDDDQADSSDAETMLA
jgi:hypothetical protein